MKYLYAVIAAALALLGLIFVVGFAGSLARLVIGVVLLIAAGALIFLARTKPQPSQTTVVQKIDLSGDVNLESMKCKVCGAPLSREEIEVRAGAIFINCSHCGATYQFEEEPKW